MINHCLTFFKLIYCMYFGDMGRGLGMESSAEMKAHKKDDLQRKGCCFVFQSQPSVSQQILLVSEFVLQFPEVMRIRMNYYMDPDPGSGNPPYKSRSRSGSKEKTSQKNQIFKLF